MSHHILLIEDNEQNSYLVSYLLQARGWTIAHAADGPTGLALADQVAAQLAG